MRPTDLVAAQARDRCCRACLPSRSSSHLYALFRHRSPRAGQPCTSTRSALDGERRSPQAGSELPPSTIRTLRPATALSTSPSGPAASLCRTASPTCRAATVHAEGREYYALRVLALANGTRLPRGLARAALPARLPGLRRRGSPSPPRAQPEHRTAPGEEVTDFRSTARSTTSPGATHGAWLSRQVAHPPRAAGDDQHSTLISLLSYFLLAIAAVATAWSSYQPRPLPPAHANEVYRYVRGTRTHAACCRLRRRAGAGVQAIDFSRANASRVESTRAPASRAGSGFSIFDVVRV